MALHPIKILNDVLDEYRDYLKTEFRAKDPALRDALERELDSPGFLAREPYYQAHRPFKAGKKWSDLPLDPKIARVMRERSSSDEAYKHQALAIEELLSPNARPVVVTTGTGSGKTEAFLLPVIQNAIEDAIAFNRSGITAILIYPMNALSNDQKLRIEDYLSASGFSGTIRVEQYDRSTSQSKRAEMRSNPPHVLLTNYMMLEYLMVRPADRDDIFANHRCRFLVLDEVHSYRGALGSNIALLVRRLREHLRRARQDWLPNVDDSKSRKRYPALIPVGTSATIKSMSEDAISPEEMLELRNRAVREFFSDLTGADRNSIQVFGEELREMVIPQDALYPAKAGVVNTSDIKLDDPTSLAGALCRLTGLPDGTPLNEVASKYRLLWDLNQLLIKKPMSVSQLVQDISASVKARRNHQSEEIAREVEAALVLGAALPDGTPGALRLRAHRFIRGGWKFHRCVNPDCGRLYPMGEGECPSCGHKAVPLYLCRNCGADYLRFVGNPGEGPLRPSAEEGDGPEWLVYEPARFDTSASDDDSSIDDEEDNGNGMRVSSRMPSPIKKRPVLEGSFDPSGLLFSENPEDYNMKVILAPARTRCLCCGGTAGSRNIITRVALGTSAAVKALSEGLVESLAEENSGKPGHDGKERLLIFSDSRQDAAHQARFIIFASRYDRMRRRLYRILMREGEISLQKAVELLAEEGLAANDNPKIPVPRTRFINEEARKRIQAWEEAPLLDEISISSGYRATMTKIGVLGVRYHELKEYIDQEGEDICRQLGIDLKQLEYLCRVLLDEMRTRGALSRQLLRYNPAYVSFPEHLMAAEWERRVKWPQGYAYNPASGAITYNDSARIPAGIKNNNSWRREGAGGRGPSLERILKHLLSRFGGNEPDESLMEGLLNFIREGSFLVPITLYGHRDTAELLQVNEETVKLYSVKEPDRFHCDICGDARPGARIGFPCSRCHGTLVIWKDAEVERHRTVRRMRMESAVPLVAGEHTAQITTADRAKLEENFKAPQVESAVNVLACSPTLEMGIDVGGLDAIVLRNVPPRPDNYAQRGGRAGRRSRVGMVFGYARSTPHDQYYYDVPEEMIAGEIPAPLLSLANRNIILRHLYAIVFGMAEPGLAGRMREYIDPQGSIVQEAVDGLIQGVISKKNDAIDFARSAWGGDVLEKAGLDVPKLEDLFDQLPEKIHLVFNSTSRQIIELRRALDYFSQNLNKKNAGVRAGELIARLLGIFTDQHGTEQDADDRSAGYPLRRFAEYGLLPGYEFPSEPSSLRLLGDNHEEDPISVSRRFGIGQFQPDAHVYARGKRWLVIGLDGASPWNPRSDTPTWPYRVCANCGLRYDADHPRCPRCSTAEPGMVYPGYGFAGFAARKEEHPVLDEEERYAVRNLVKIYPQWDGIVTGRWNLANNWSLRLSKNEQVCWLNEGPPPKPADFSNNTLILHRDAKGFLICPSCGRMLEKPETDQVGGRGRRNPAMAAAHRNAGGHAESCHLLGNAPQPVSIVTSSAVEVLRLIVPVPADIERDSILPWGISTGYALLYGMEHHFMLDSAELDFELEGPWNVTDGGQKFGLLSLAFIDNNIGGSGYFERIADEFHHVAQSALKHLDHEGCDTACYRCLKGYRNQRYHDVLNWQETVPALKDIAEIIPVTKPLSTTDIDDPMPWLEAYEAGVGSPLELKFLRLFEKHGFSPAKQVPVAPLDGQPPISVADFAVPERRLAIYIDGSAFHVGRNLRRDKRIRDRLRNGNPPWRVEEIVAGDMRNGEELVKRLLK